MNQCTRSFKSIWTIANTETNLENVTTNTNKTLLVLGYLYLKPFLLTFLLPKIINLFYF